MPALTPHSFLPRESAKGGLLPGTPKKAVPGLQFCVQEVPRAKAAAALGSSFPRQTAGQLSVCSPSCSQD